MHRRERTFLTQQSLLASRTGDPERFNNQPCGERTISDVLSAKDESCNVFLPDCGASPREMVACFFLLAIPKILMLDFHQWRQGISTMYLYLQRLRLEEPKNHD